MDTDNRLQRQLQSLEDDINELNSDYRAEVIAAEFIESGYNLDELFIIRNGGAQRQYSKDIARLKLSQSDIDLKDYLHIIVNRDSLYDILPEGLFHQSVFQKTERTQKEVVEEIAIQRNEELADRRFFVPFEISIDQRLTQAQLFENRFDKQNKYRDFVNVFTPYWPVLKLLNLEQSILFMNIVPILHKVRHNFADISKSLSLILNTPISIERSKLLNKTTEIESCLGEQRLNIDSIIGDSFDDGLLDIKLIIGPIPGNKMELFLDTRENSVILDKLCDIFLPANLNVTKSYKTFSDDSIFILSHDETMAYLGINTFL